MVRNCKKFPERVKNKEEWGKNGQNEIKVRNTSEMVRNGQKMIKEVVKNRINESFIIDLDNRVVMMAFVRLLWSGG